MPIMGTLNDIADLARREVDRARIHSHESLSVSAGPYWATLLFNGDAIIGEVVSNVVLPADEALGPQQEDRLESLGWTRPDGRSRPYFDRRWFTLEASETIVRDLLTAFICVAELEEGEQVTCGGGYWCGVTGWGCAGDAHPD